jgi:hypothetical protein
MRPSLSDQRGAAMAFGLFFAVFLLASVYRLHGIVEAILYRQHQQDAADAAAFTGAVVCARGMNLLALINMTMAAALAVLVGLRLAQTLCLLGIVLCGALATPTMGASMNFAPRLAKAAVRIERLARQVNKRLPGVLSQLHRAGKAVSVVVPVGAAGRVVDVGVGQYGMEYALAVPGRLALPVEDGSFYDLCRHAGELAGRVAFLPVAPVVSGRVEDGLASAVGALATAAPDWFCGKSAKGKKPDMDPGGELDPLILPVLPGQRACSELSSKYAKREATPAQLLELETVCESASLEQLASTPGRDGRAREGEPLCPHDCVTNPRASCPPEGGTDCDPAMLEQVHASARRLGRSTLVPGGDDSPFAKRLRLAHEQCDPAAPHTHPLGGFSWTQQFVTYAYEWNGLHYERHEVQTLHPPRVVRLSLDDRSLPCGPQGAVGEHYGNDPRVVCESPPACTDPFGKELAGMARQACPGHGGHPMRYWESVTRVTGILQCAELRPHDKVETPDLDLELELAGTRQKGQNTSPLQLESGAWLGGSDFQQRAVTIGKQPAFLGDEVVQLAAWGASDHERASLSEVSESVGAVALSQAEYYFDVRTFDKFADQSPQHSDRIEWMWHQGWVARLRPFRLHHGKADGPRKGEARLDTEQREFSRDTQAVPEQDLSRCVHRLCRPLSAFLAGPEEER